MSSRRLPLCRITRSPTPASSVVLQIQCVTRRTAGRRQRSRQNTVYFIPIITDKLTLYRLREERRRIDIHNLTYLFDNHNAGLSSLVVSTRDRGARGPSIEPVLQTCSVFFTKISAIRSFRRGLHAYCSA